MARDSTWHFYIDCPSCTTPLTVQAPHLCVYECMRVYAPSGYKLSGGVTELEPYMVVLDRATQDPRLLMMLVSALLQPCIQSGSGNRSLTRCSHACIVAIGMHDPCKCCLSERTGLLGDHPTASPTNTICSLSTSPPQSFCVASIVPLPATLMQLHGQL